MPPLDDVEILEALSADARVRREEYIEAMMQLTPDERAAVGDKPTIFEPVTMLLGDHILIEGGGTRIDSFVKLEGGQGLHIGRGVHIASFAHIGIGGGTTILEDYCAVASGGKVISGSNQINAISCSAAAPKEMQYATRSVTRIKRYAFIATNAVVMPGVTLGEGAVLAAGGVATCDIPDWQVWAGVPAKMIRKRHLSAEQLAYKSNMK